MRKNLQRQPKYLYFRLRKNEGYTTEKDSWLCGYEISETASTVYYMITNYLCFGRRNKIFDSKLVFCVFK
ncbi:unnamed protein product [Rhizophagus irregularis]|nr:unnamed protein product [Rhizophagus irregularis]CAB4404535.1 unnamed protein product [Rhizophagus irregularis]